MSNLFTAWVRSTLFGAQPKREKHNDQFPGLTLPKVKPRAPLPHPFENMAKRDSEIENIYEKFLDKKGAKKPLQAKRQQHWSDRLKE